MSDTATAADGTDLLAQYGFTGASAAMSGALVDGHDFYPDDEAGPHDSGYQGEKDTISDAIGSVEYMSNFTVSECFQQLDGAQTEPEVFDRYYFPPQVDGYTGLAPLLIDVLEGVTPEELRQQQEDKHVAFKTAWCRSHGIRYAVITDTEDAAFLTPPQLRQKIEALTAYAALDHVVAVDLDLAIISFAVAPIAAAPAPRKRASTSRSKAKPGARRAGVQKIRG